MEGDSTSFNAAVDDKISIHALRVEGDPFFNVRIAAFSEFLSTPSGWRATISLQTAKLIIAISIHALRVEGDRI